MTTIDKAAISRLLERVREEVDAGLLPSCQIALGFDGELVVNEAYGDATVDSRYVVFSSTKAFVASVVWMLIADGLVDVSKRVAEYIPEFATNGKEGITVEQVMLHTSGFPHAPLGPPAWSSREGRLAAFSRWRLNWEPGTSYEYHATSAHWVLAEIIDRVTTADYRDVVEQHVTGPIGVPRVLGIPVDAQDGIKPVVMVGEPATTAEIREAFGVDSLPTTEVTPEALAAFNDPAIRAVGVPGGGGCMRASDLAVFYQALLHNPGEMWRPDVLADATGTVRNRLPDRWRGHPASRSLGLVVAGADGLSHVRGMGRAVSARAFGHNGAGGQLAWADPATGLSLGYTTNGFDLNVAREHWRSSAIATLAALCAS